MFSFAFSEKDVLILDLGELYLRSDNQGRTPASSQKDSKVGMTFHTVIVRCTQRESWGLFKYELGA